MTASKPSGHNSQDILNRKAGSGLSPRNSKYARHRPGLQQRSWARRRDSRLPNNSKPKPFGEKLTGKNLDALRGSTEQPQSEPEIDREHRQLSPEDRHRALRRARGRPRKPQRSPFRRLAHQSARQEQRSHARSPPENPRRPSAAFAHPVDISVEARRHRPTRCTPAIAGGRQPRQGAVDAVARTGKSTWGGYEPGGPRAQQGPRQPRRAPHAGVWPQRQARSRPDTDVDVQ